MNAEKKTKIMMVSGVALFALAVMVLLLFVLPAARLGSTPSEAQPPGASPPGGGGTYGMSPTEAAPAADAFKGAPLEPSRTNPFARPGGVGVTATAAYRTGATRYGPDWSRLPLTLRKPFMRPWRAPHPAPAPTQAQAETTQEGTVGLFRVSSVMWAQGKPSATYETPDGKSGSVGPGDLIGNWRVTEIGSNYMIVQNTQTNVVQRLPLKSGD